MTENNIIDQIATKAIEEMRHIRASTLLTDADKAKIIWLIEQRADEAARAAMDHVSEQRETLRMGR